MPSRLPPLKTLEGFDAAARLGSFASAADMMNVTQSAISHQMKALEDALGQQLFRRLHREVVLTDAGRDFHKTVRQVLQGLREGVRKLAPYRKPNTVIVYCESALANGWLVPRLPALTAAHPGIDIWLDTRGCEVDPARDEVDVFIASHDVDVGANDDGREPLIELQFRPVACPELASLIPAEFTVEHVSTCPLLHVEGGIDWPNWFADHGGCASDDRFAVKLAQGPNFSDAYTMLLSASHGVGIGLAPTALATPFVQGAKLSWVGERVLSTDLRYQMQVSYGRSSDENVDIVAAWLREQASELRLP